MGSVPMIVVESLVLRPKGSFKLFLGPNSNGKLESNPVGLHFHVATSSCRDCYVTEHFQEFKHFAAVYGEHRPHEVDKYCRAQPNGTVVLSV